MELASSHQNLLHHRFRADIEISPSGDGSKESFCRAAPQSIPQCSVRIGEPGLPRPVHVHDLVSHLGPGFHQIIDDGQPIMEVFDGQVAACLVIRRVPILLDPHVLRFLEVGQHVLVTPSLVTHPLPIIVILSVPTNVQHYVQYATSAQHLHPSNNT